MSGLLPSFNPASILLLFLQLIPLTGHIIQRIHGSLLAQDALVDFGAGENRWGDYSSTVLDPENEDIFWTIQEWGSDPAAFASGLGDTWSTQISELISQPIPLPSTLLLLGSGLLGLGGIRRLKKS